MRALAAGAPIGTEAADVRARVDSGGSCSRPPLRSGHIRCTARHRPAGHGSARASSVLNASPPTMRRRIRRTPVPASRTRARWAGVSLTTSTASSSNTRRIGEPGAVRGLRRRSATRPPLTQRHEERGDGQVEGQRGVEREIHRLPVAVDLARPPEVVDQAPLGDQRALGPAGGAGGVDHIGEIGVGDGPRRRRGRQIGRQAVVVVEAEPRQRRRQPRRQAMVVSASSGWASATVSCRRSAGMGGIERQVGGARLEHAPDGHEHLRPMGQQQGNQAVSVRRPAPADSRASWLARRSSAA